MQKKEVILRPIKESTKDYEAIEQIIIEALRREIYLPILAELKAPPATLQNSNDALKDALMFGRVTFIRGVFRGKFNAAISKQLRSVGAKWDWKSGTFRIPFAQLPQDLRSAISASEARFAEKIKKIDKKLEKLLPEEIAEKIKVEKHFDAALWKVEKDFQDSVKGITIAPKLTPEMRKRIASEWQKNMDLWVVDFSEKEILSLRKEMTKSVFAGNRYESAIKTIQDSFGVSQRKAKFLARQETNLAMAKLKQLRYEDAGVREYIWGCVAGSKNHPVRASHKALEGKVFRWDDPPITTGAGQPVRRNNPAQDYNCRCFARPIVKFGDGKKK